MTWILFVIFCGFGGELPLGTVCPEFFLEFWEFHGAIRAVWVLDLMSSPFSHTSHEASCRRHRCITRSTASLEVRILVRFLVTFWPLQWEKYKRPSSLSILECEKILYEKMVRAIVLYIVQNSGMFWNALFLYLLAAYVLSGFVIRIYIYTHVYIYIYPSILVLYITF